MAEEQPPSPPRRSEREQTLGWYRMTSAGLEFIVALLLPGALGWYLDRRLGTGPWLLIVGFALGFAVGLTMLIRMARRSFHD